MSTVPASPLEVQAFYSTRTGMLIREDGKTRPATLDDIEQTYGQAALDDVMSMPGHWHDLITAPVELKFTARCRCWSHPRGEWVAIVLPGIGKVQVSIDKATSDANVLAIFNRVLEADMLARRNMWKRDGSDKAYVGVMAQEVQAVMPDAVVQGPDGYLRVDYDRLGFRMQGWEQWVVGGERIPAVIRH